MNESPKVPKHLPPSSTIAPVWIAEHEVLSRFGISLRTLRRWHAHEGLPKYKVGKLIYYTEDDINEMIKKHKSLPQEPTQKIILNAGGKTMAIPRLINVGIVDDHLMFIHPYIMFLNTIPGIRAILEAYSGEQLLDKLQRLTDLPDILLMDVLMEEMDGAEVTRLVTERYPTIKVVAFSSSEESKSLFQMVQAGACSYLTKKMPPAQMKEALYEIHLKGKYKADLFHLYAAELRNFTAEMKRLSFTDNEKRFLQYLANGYTYGEMAKEMNVSVDSIDYYFGCLSRKLNTKSQITMVLQARYLGIVSLEEEKKRN